MTEDALAEALAAAARDDWKTAQDVCRRELSGAVTPQDERLWGLQLAFALFQDEGNVDATYTQCHEVLDELARKYPDAADIAFWQGYMGHIYYYLKPTAVDAAMNRCFLSDPGHGYAHCFEANDPEKTPEPFARIGHYFAALARQPGNRAALGGLLALADQLALSAVGGWVCREVLTTEPFRETTLGVGGRYVNDVILQRAQDAALAARAGRVQLGA